MALNDTQVVLPAKGGIYAAAVGSAVPTSLTAVGSPWEAIGHTSLDDLPEFGNDGGDSETLGTWQNASFRVVQTEASVDYVVFNALQFSSVVMAMYYGSTGEGSPSGQFDVDAVGANKLERALLITINDGANVVGFHAPKASFGRDDSLSLENDAFAQFPIRATFLKMDEDTPLFSWVYPDLGAVTAPASGGSSTTTA